MDVKQNRETLPENQLNMITLEPDPYEPDSCYIRYIEVLTTSGTRICLPLNWYRSMDDLIKRTEKVLYTT
jgi:hypothetical protein